MNRFRHVPPACVVVFSFGGLIHTALDMFNGHLFLLAPISFVRQKISLAEYVCGILFFRVYYCFGGADVMEEGATLCFPLKNFMIMSFACFRCVV